MTKNCSHKKDKYIVGQWLMCKQCSRKVKKLKCSKKELDNYAKELELKIVVRI